MRIKIQPRIGLDLNGVILNVNKLKSEIAMVAFQNYIHPEEFNSEIVIREKKILTFQEYKELQNYIYQNDFIANRMELIPGINNYLPRLSRLGDLIVLTSCYYDSFKVSKEILQAKKIAHYFKEIHNTNPGVSKGEVVKVLNLDFYIDDDVYKLHNLLEVVPHNLLPKLYLLNYSYNQNDACPDVKRVHSFYEFYTMVEKQLTDACFKK